jgi:alanyl-tRNA synthetase
MRTRRLFDDDSHLCDFEARIAALRIDGPWVALNATAFFPEDGGQPSDRGTLGGVDVVELAVDSDGTIWHRLARTVDGEVGSIVEGRVDATLRRDHRQQHTGQHILSRAFLEVHGAETRSFHLGTDVSTIDLAIDALDPDRILAAEGRANAVVFEDRAVVVTAEERVDGPPLRTVAIAGLEEQHCCGTHVRSTGEIGLIKVLRWEKIRGLTRAHFVCGARALRVFASLVETVDAAARPFSAGWLDLPRVVQGALDQTKTLERRVRDWQRRWALLESDRIARETPRPPDGLLVVRAWVEAADAEALRVLASTLTEREGAIVLLAGSGEPDRRVWLAARSKDLPAGHAFDAKAVLAGILESLGGRGGGNALFAQGSCPADEKTCRARLASTEL